MSSSQQNDESIVSSQAAVAYFDRHADHYAKNQYGTTRRTFINGRHDQIVSLLSSLSLGSGATVLDAGCGPGNLVPELSKRAGRVCAMDASPRMVEIAQDAARACTNVQYKVGSIEDLPYPDDSFDLVCSAGVIEYLPDCGKAISEMYRVLRPGGLLVLPTTNVIAPAHWLRRVLGPVARIPVIARRFGLQPGRYRLWYHFIPRFQKRVRSAGFVLERERYFYLTLPRPLDRLFPVIARGVESRLDRYMDTPLRHLAEGYIAVGRKPTPVTGPSKTGGSL